MLTHMFGVNIDDINIINDIVSISNHCCETNSVKISIFWVCLGAILHRNQITIVVLFRKSRFMAGILPIWRKTLYNQFRKTFHIDISTSYTYWGWLSVENILISNHDCKTYPLGFCMDSHKVTLFWILLGVNIDDECFYNRGRGIPKTVFLNSRLNKQLKQFKEKKVVLFIHDIWTLWF